MGAIGRQSINIDQLADALPVSRKGISSAVGRLVARGYVERLEIGVYRLTVSGQEALGDGSARRFTHYRTRKDRICPDSLRQRAWKAMRLQIRFAIGDIVTLAARPNDRNPENALNRWFKALTRTGHIVELPVRARGAAPTSNGFKQWRLVRDTGDIAPSLRGDGSVVDRNTGEVFPCA
nr:hypothetical protein [Phreatobacter stygius]